MFKSNLFVTSFSNCDDDNVSICGWVDVVANDDDSVVISGFKGTDDDEAAELLILANATNDDRPWSELDDDLYLLLKHGN